MANIRPWQRDMDAQHECGRSPLLPRQVADLVGFPSTKEAAERLSLLHRAGILKRTPYFQPAARGKPAFAYFTGPPPHSRTLAHTILTADVHVQAAQWLRTTTDVAAEFYYGHEVHTSAGIMPDAALIIHKTGKTGLLFFEVDNGTEVTTSPTRYSLAKKLAAYASYFDSQAYVADFAWAGPLRGFRVGLIVPAGRWRFVQRLVASEQHDFVLTTTFERLKHGIAQPIWLAHDGMSVDLLGRPGGEMIRDLLGEMVRPARPASAGEKS